jgi:hypothetical protein
MIIGFLPTGYSDVQPRAPRTRAQYLRGTFFFNQDANTIHLATQMLTAQTKVI